jgi:ADP-heptose:LPS heptosyltransferase
LKILVFRIGQLGDTIVALPAMWVIRRHFPEAQLTLLSDRHPGKPYVLAADLLKGAGLFDQFESYVVDDSAGGRMLRAARMAQLVMKLRRQRFDSLVYLAPSARTASQIERDRKFFALAGIKRFYGMNGFRTLPRKVPGQPLGATPSEADLLLERLAADGLPVPAPGEGCLELRLGEPEETEVENWLRQQPDDGRRPWIGVGPGSKMPAKRWPEERFREVVSQLVREFDLWPVVFGGPEDKPMGQRLLAAWQRGYNAAGALSLRAAAAALKRCRLYLGNDTGTMHLAAAAGVPCIAVFSARTNPGLWNPYGVEQKIFRTQIECEGCGLVECIELGNECLNRISGEEVFRACGLIIGFVGKAEFKLTARQGFDNDQNP